MVTVCVGENTIVNLFNSAGPRESQCHVNGFHFPLIVCPAASHLPKVLILQSASARAGRGSHFFGSVPWAGASRRADEGRGYGARICCVWSSRPVVRGSEVEDGTSVQENVDHVSAVCKWNVKRISASAIV